jgi:predicted Zn finger-like uncharacterized protein
VQFSCDSCKTLLQIADEKVRGKRLVVRCKRCGAKITISDPLLANKLTRARASVPAPVPGAPTAAAPAPAPAPAAPPAPVAAPTAAAPAAADPDPKRDSDTENTVAMDSDLLERAVLASKSENPDQVLAVSRPPPAAPDQAIWFAMLQGKQIGPLTRGDLAGRATSGEVGPRTYLWKEGMDSWQRARDVAELSALFPLPVTPSVPITVPPPPVQTPDPSASETLPEPEAQASSKDESATNPDMMPLGEQVHQDEVAQQLFTSGEHATSPSSAADLASWANSDLGRPTNPGVAKARPAQAPVAAESSRPKPVPVPAPAQPAARMFESAAPPRSRAPLVLFILVLLATVAVGAWVYMGMERNPAGAPAPASEAPDAAVAAPPPAPPAKPAPIETAAIPVAGLSAEQVRKKLDENKGNLQTCIDDAQKRDPNLRVGRIHLTTTIAPSGQVSATKIDKRAVDESALGVCLKRSTGKLVFPSFQGKPFEVDIPITVGGE